MPISVVCSHCQSKLKVPEAAAGKKARCPRCKGVIAIPEPEEELVEPDAEGIEAVNESKATAAPATPKKKAAWDDGDEPETPSESEDRDEYGISETPKKKKRRYEDDDDDEDEDEEEERRPRKRRRRTEYNVPSRRRGMAHRGTTILTLGIVTILATCVCPLIAVITGVKVMGMADSDLHNMDRGLMDRTGRASTQIGKICAIIGIVLGVINAIGVIILNVTRR